MRFTGAGLCAATPGPGTVDLLNGLYDMNLNHQPVVAIIPWGPWRLISEFAWGDG